MTLTTRYQVTVLLFLLAIAGLLGIQRIIPTEKPRVMVLSQYEVEDELGYKWFVMQYLSNANVEQVNCNSFEQALEVKEYLGVKQ